MFQFSFHANSLIGIIFPHFETFHEVIFKQKHFISEEWCIIIPDIISYLKNAL